VQERAKIRLTCAGEESGCKRTIAVPLALPFDKVESDHGVGSDTQGAEGNVDSLP
jgi:hypothetical protein